MRVLTSHCTTDKSLVPANTLVHVPTVVTLTEMSSCFHVRHALRRCRGSGAPLPHAHNCWWPIEPSACAVTRAVKKSARVTDPADACPRALPAALVLTTMLAGAPIAEGPELPEPLSPSSCKSSTCVSARPSSCVRSNSAAASLTQHPIMWAAVKSADVAAGIGVRKDVSATTTACCNAGGSAHETTTRCVCKPLGCWNCSN